MGPKQPSETKQVTEVKLPKWVDAASQENYNFAKQIADKPFQQYAGDTVANFDYDTLKAFKFFKQNMGSGQDSFNDAASALRELTGFDPGRITGSNVANRDVVAGQIKDTDLSAYMNPFIDNVETHALGALDDSRLQALMGNADAASKAKAFGGSRSAIVDAVTNAEAAKAAGGLSANLRSTAFDNAQKMAMGDIDRRLQGDMFNADGSLKAGMANQANALAVSQGNVEAALKAAGIKTGAASGLLDAGNAIRAANQEDFQGLLGIGQLQQQQQQKEIDARVNKFTEKRDHDLERLNILLSSLGMSPYGKTESTTKTQQDGGGTDWAQMGLGIFSLLGGLSDRSTKTDIEKVGKDEATGLDLYAFRYKKDPKTYPKVVGPMAQDIKKKFPDLVGIAGGKLFVKGMEAGRG